MDTAPIESPPPAVARDADIGMAAIHRRAFLEALGTEAALLFGAPVKIRNNDADYRYRQSSDVMYLAAWPDPECALLFRPGSDAPFTMFVQKNDPEREVWTGRRPGPEGAVAGWGADAAFAFDELAEKLPDMLMGYRTLHYRIAEDGENDRLVTGAIARARRKARNNGLDLPDAFIDPARVLHELRLRKSPEELALLRRAADITAEAHEAAMRATAPGVPEYEIEAIIDHVFRRRGGAGPGYPTIVGGGANATVLHYVANDAPLKDGDLVCVDAGCEFRGYTADVTRTWPVSGRFTGPQRELYDLVLAAQEAAIEQIGVGSSWRRMHDAATRVLAEGLLRLGFLPAWTSEAGHPEDEHLDKLIAEEKHKRWYMHGTGHWLGLDVHDVGHYVGGGEARPFAAGMVTTVEPGLYVAQGDEEAPARFRGIGIRIEDDVLVTGNGREILTAAIPKRADEIEAIVGRR